MNMIKVILFTTLISVVATAQDSNTSGNQNICKPVINVNSCKKCDTTCSKPKIVYKTRYKTKTVPGPIVTEIKHKIIEKTIVKKPRRNRIKLLAGLGLQGVDAERISRLSAQAQADRGFIFGVGYDRLITDKISIGIQVQSNKSALGSVGFDF